MGAVAQPFPHGVLSWRAATAARAPDLKPQNIMLVPDSHVNLGERAKLLDFGLAKVKEERPTMQEVAAELDVLRMLFPPPARRSSMPSIPALASLISRPSMPAVMRPVDPFEATCHASQLSNPTTLPEAAAEVGARLPRHHLMAAGMVGMLLGIVGVCVLTLSGNRTDGLAPARQRSAASSHAAPAPARVEPPEVPEPPPQPLLVGMNAEQSDGGASLNQHRFHGHKERSSASLRNGPAPPLPAVRLSHNRPTRARRSR